MKYSVDDLILLNMAGVGMVRLRKMERDLFNARDIIDAGKDRLKREWKLIKKDGVTVLPFYHEDYPESLKNIYDPPIVLYVKGDIAFKRSINIAFVGSRRASNYGMDMCRKLSLECGRIGITIVSGLARGIDSQAHKAALEAGGRTIAVLGSGLAHVYPPENKGLADKISESGAVVSEFPMETHPAARNFPIRNRVISGLSAGVVVVEAADKSGALITADCALEQGRDVFAVPGKAGSVTAAGVHRLIRTGAKLVERAEDILEELNPSLIPESKKITLRLSGAEKIIYDTLSDEPSHIDDITDRSKLATKDVIGLLTVLESKRLIKELPGKNFVSR